MGGHDVIVIEADPTFLNNVRQRLLMAENSITPAVLTAKTILDGLVDQLSSMLDKGFSFQELSQFLSSSDIELSPNAIQAYFEYIKTKRLVACEKILLGCYKPACSRKVDRSLLIERGLRKSLKDGVGFVLNYQPQFDLITESIIGAEALLRWNLDGEVISPGEFIVVAEESGLISEIGEWVLAEACAEAMRWKTMGLGGERGIRVAVNLSVKQLSDDLPGLVHAIVVNSGLPVHLLELEITESFLAGNESLAVLHALSNSGISLSVDDFGTGYSCLSGLKNLPLDTIKIDRAFVEGVEAGGRSLAVVESIIDLAHKLGMHALAEGVESEEQVAILRALGCSIGQGFFYSRPLSGDAFVEFVKGVSHRGVLASKPDLSRCADLLSLRASVWNS